MAIHFESRYEEINTYGMIDKNNRLDLKKSIQYWQDYLFNRCMRLIIVDTNLFPPDEFKKRMLIAGQCCVKHSDIYDNVGVYWCQISDNTGQYRSLPLSVTYESTNDTGLGIVGVDCVYCKNTSLALPISPLINRYALILAHYDLTLIQAIVNIRCGKNMITTSSDQMAKSVEEAYNDLYNGKIGVIVDDLMMQGDGISHIPICDADSARSVVDLIEGRNNIITLFYNDIGVQSSKAKKGNMLIPEIESDKPKLLLSLNEMLDYWRLAGKEITAMFGGMFTARLSEEIAEQFSTSKKIEGGGANENDNK